jgi:predicted P-loop ATPase
VNKLDFAAINDALNAEMLVPTWLPGGERRGDEYVVANPTRNDRNPGSFTINLRKGVWKDYATGDGGADLVSLYAYLFHGDDQGAAARELADNHGIRLDNEARQRAHDNKVAKLDEARPECVFPVPVNATSPTFRHPRWGQPSNTWAYRNGDGELMLYVCRFDPEGERKQVVPYSWCKHPDGRERWTWRGITGTKKRPLYGLERLQGMPDSDVIVVEGEKAADAGQQIFGERAAVVTWMGGVETADRANVRALEGRRVFLWPDFDSQRDDAGELKPLHEQPGMRAMMHIATALRGVARETHMVRYRHDDESFPHGWDLADAPQRGWDVRDVMQYMGDNTGDPWAIASSKPLTPANDNTPPAANTPLDAAVNPFGFPHLTDKGQPMNTWENLAYIMSEYGIAARYNHVRKQVEVTLPGRSYSAANRANCTLAELSSICSRNRMPKADLQDYVKIIADRHAYNPVRDWIASKPWDGVTRLPALYATLHAADTAMRDTLVFRWLLSAVAATFKETGFHSRGVLVLMGPQGSGKTSWLRALAPADMNVFLDGAVLDPANKDLVKNAVSHWIVELGELDATFRKADIARLKAFVTLPNDKLRLPYDRIESEYPRSTVLSASVNEERYLVDDTGNSRWWTVRVSRCDFRHGIDMQQLWAEVRTHFERGEQWWLTDDEERALAGRNEEHEAVDPVEEMISQEFDWAALPGFGWRDMTASEVLAVIGYDKPNKPQATHASKVLKKLTGKDPRKSGSRRLFSMPPRMDERRRARSDDDSDRPI